MTSSVVRHKNAPAAGSEQRWESQEGPRDSCGDKLSPPAGMTHEDVRGMNAEGILQLRTASTRCLKCANIYLTR
jgi:hypothetical protein